MDLGREVVEGLRRHLGAVMDTATQRQDVAGREGRRVVDMRGIGRPLQSRPWQPLALFDLYDRTSTTFKVRGHDLQGVAGDDHCIIVAGKQKVVGSGVAGFGLDEAVTVAAARYVCLLDTITESEGASVHTVTLEIIASPMPDGGDTSPGVTALLYVPLWWVPWVTSRIDWDAVVDLRNLPVLPFGGN